MDSKYSIGRVHKVYPDKLIVEIPDTKEIHFVYRGHFYETKGINTFVTIFNGFNKRFTFQIVGLYEYEKPLLVDESAKLNSHAYFECIPIGEIESGVFEYGLLNYPMISDEVYLTSETDLDIIFNKNDVSIELGVIPSQNDYIPSISLNGLFTHHMSILGNTNSGKSTTARKIIQSLVENERIDKEKLNFLIFDIHDEYEFLSKDLIKTIHMDDIAINLESLTSEDWINLVRPSDRVQLPVLKQAIKLANIINQDDEIHNAIKVYCAVETFKRHPNDGVVKRNLVINHLRDSDFTSVVNYNFSKDYHEIYANIKDENIEKFYQKVGEYFQVKMSISYNEFYSLFQEKLTVAKDNVSTFSELLLGIEYLFVLEESHGNRSIRSHTSTLVTRIEEVKTQYENNLFNQCQDKINTLSEILRLEYLEPFLRFDVSKLPNEDLLFFSSYILERLYRNQVEKRVEVQTLVHCIFDEAHQYIREHYQEERLQTLHTFEKVAREGRKFGLFMIVISQRPSELSQTVLSQCNNFILHRIRNSADLEFMRKSIPYLTNHQLNRLSYMRSGTAILVGEAFSIPMELKVRADDNNKSQSNTFSPSTIWFSNIEEEEE